MSTKPRVSIAGVGIAKAKQSSLLASATKALLDAGIHFDDVDKAIVSSKDGCAAVKAFDHRGIETTDVKAGTELQKAYSLVSSGDARCVLVLTDDKVRMDLTRFRLWVGPH